MELGLEDRLTKRAVAIAATLALGLGAAACGSGDDDGGDGKASASTAAQEVDDGTPEGAVRARYAEFIDAMYDADAKSVCSMLTSEAKQSIGDGTNCPATFRTYLSRVKLGRNRPVVLRVNLDGGRARAVVKTKNSERYVVPFAKEQAVWKINGGF